ETWAVAEYKKVPVYTLSVYSSGVTGNNVPISSTTGHGGNTNYSKSVLESTWVVLTAPETFSSGGNDYTFVCWWYSGYSSSIGSRTINFTMSGGTWAVAQYKVAERRTLNVYSFPVTGVSITGTHPSTTNYSMQVLDGTWVAVTAPATAGGYRFVRWWYNGYQISSATVNLSISSNTTLAAEYASSTTRISARSSGSAMPSAMSEAEACDDPQCP
ncbi:MAG: hypothetical protein GX542_01075, partial [Rhodococcus sp.]|nr:hypothetical protein [Rhodococcus sp. (in: high G+C Gram-positive bacteria)]